MSLSAAAKQKYLSILALYHRAPLAFEEARGGAVTIWTRAGGFSTQLSLLNPLEIIIDLPFGFPINHIISLSLSLLKPYGLATSHQ